jgi:hypothetical protein
MEVEQFTMINHKYNGYSHALMLSPNNACQVKTEGICYSEK